MASDREDDEAAMLENNARTARAVAFLEKELGISSSVVTPVLKALLQTFEGEWSHIESDGYRLLVDEIFNQQEIAVGTPSTSSAGQKKGKRKAPSVTRTNPPRRLARRAQQVQDSSDSPSSPEPERPCYKLSQQVVLQQVSKHTKATQTDAVEARKTQMKLIVPLNGAELQGRLPPRGAPSMTCAPVGSYCRKSNHVHIPFDMSKVKIEMEDSTKSSGVTSAYLEPDPKKQAFIWHGNNEGARLIKADISPSATLKGISTTAEVSWSPAMGPKTQMTVVKKECLNPEPLQVVPPTSSISLLPLPEVDTGGSSGDGMQRTPIVLTRELTQEKLCNGDSSMGLTEASKQPAGSSKEEVIKTDAKRQSSLDKTQGDGLHALFISYEDQSDSSSSDSLRTSRRSDKNSNSEMSRVFAEPKMNHEGIHASLTGGETKDSLHSHTDQDLLATSHGPCQPVPTTCDPCGMANENPILNGQPLPENHEGGKGNIDIVPYISPDTREHGTSEVLVEEIVGADRQENVKDIEEMELSLGHRKQIISTDFVPENLKASEGRCSRSDGEVSEAKLGNNSSKTACISSTSSGSGGERRRRLIRKTQIKTEEIFPAPEDEPIHENGNGNGTNAKRHNPSDISRGKEAFAIPLLSASGHEDLPDDFLYIRKSMVYQHGHTDFSLARIGEDDCCKSCAGNCLDRPVPCACARLTDGEFAYTVEGCLYPNFIQQESDRKYKPNALAYCQPGACPFERTKSMQDADSCKGHTQRRFIKECWDMCGCTQQCGNRVVQRGISRRLQVFWTEEGKGWGVQTLEYLPAGTFVCEYVGEILTNDEMDQRNMDTPATSRHHFALQLDADWCSERLLKNEEALCLDGTRFGNVARFINHRCFDSNLLDIPVEIESPDHHYYHVAFFTKAEVQAEEELTWDYGLDFKDKDHPIEAFKCLCGSTFCRGKVVV